MSDSEDSSISSVDENLKNSSAFNDDASVSDAEARSVNRKRAAGGDDDSEEEDENDENNEYEKDGFVVSDNEDNSDGESDSDARAKQKRKRRRLKKGTAAALDDDDYQLIKENLRHDDEDEDNYPPIKEDFKTYGDEYSGFRNGAIDAESVDSEGMDEFIVDEGIDLDRTGKFNKNAHRAKAKQTSTDYEFAEELNDEFLELFGYDKDEYEATELAGEVVEASRDAGDDAELDEEVSRIGRPKRPKQRKSGVEKEKLISQTQFEDLSRNYLLEEDEEMVKLDVPERVQLMEKKFGLQRDKFNRGEFYLRFPLREVNSRARLVLEVDKQRVSQAKWVYERLLESFNLLRNIAAHEYETLFDQNFFTFESVKPSLLYVLHQMQVNCAEPGFLFVYKKKEIGQISLEYLHSVQKLIYDHVECVVFADKLMKYIESHIPSDAPDESSAFGIGSQAPLVRDEEVSDYMSLVKYNGRPLVDEELQVDINDFMDHFVLDNIKHVEFNVMFSKQSLREKLLSQLYPLQPHLDLKKLRAIQNYLFFKFGPGTLSAPGKSSQRLASEIEDEVFNQFDSEYDLHIEGTSGAHGIRRRTLAKSSRLQLISSFPEAGPLLNAILVVPFLGRSLKNRLLDPDHDPIEACFAVDDFYVNNPLYVASMCLKQDDGGSRFGHEINNFFSLLISSLAKEMILHPDIQDYLKHQAIRKVLISVKAGPKFEQLLPDFANEYIKLVGISNKPVDAFLYPLDGKEFRWDFLLIMKGVREGFLEVEYSVQSMVDAFKIDYFNCLFNKATREHLDAENLNLRTLLSAQITESKMLWQNLRIRVFEHFQTNYFVSWVKRMLENFLIERAEFTVGRQVYFAMMDNYCRSPVTSYEFISPNQQDVSAGFVSKYLLAPPYSPDTLILSLFLSEDKYNFENFSSSGIGRRDLGIQTSSAVLVDGTGQQEKHIRLPSLLEMQKLKDIIRTIINENAPQIVVLNGGLGLKEKHLNDFLKELTYENFVSYEKRIQLENVGQNDIEDINPSKEFIILNLPASIGAAVAQVSIIEDVAVANDSTSIGSSIGMRSALSLARTAIDPFKELAKLYWDMSRTDLARKSTRSPILGIMFHARQNEVPQNILLANIERAFLDYTAVNGVGFNDLFESTHPLLQFVPGLGPRKAKRLCTKLSRSRNRIYSRLQLKDFFTRKVIRSVSRDLSNITAVRALPAGFAPLNEVLAKLNLNDEYLLELYKTDPQIPGLVYENAIAFLRFSHERLDNDVEEQRELGVNYLDETRIHPSQYKLAALICWKAMYTDKPLPKFLIAPQNKVESDDESDVGDDDNVMDLHDRDDYTFAASLSGAVRKYLSGRLKSRVERDNQKHGVGNFALPAAREFYHDFFNNNYFYPSLAKLNSLLKPGDTEELSKFLNETGKRMELDLEELIDFCQLQMNWTTDAHYEVFKCIEEIEYPFCERKQQFKEAFKLTPLDQFFGSDVASLTKFSYVSGEIVEFSHRGIFLRLPNGLRATVAVSDIPKLKGDIIRPNLSISREQQVQNYCNKELGLKVGDFIQVWIKDVETDTFRVNCTMSQQDALDGVVQLNRLLDPFWREKALEEQVSKLMKTEKEDIYLKRRITHPHFVNCDKMEFDKKWRNMAEGDFFFYPSSKGLQFLNLYWKTIGGRPLNKLIEEQVKDKNDPELGKMLVLGRETYEDLDDIISNYINPINTFLAEVVSFSKHYRNVDMDKAAELCRAMKSQEPKHTPYLIIPDAGSPTSFLFVFLLSRLHHIRFSVHPTGFILDGASSFNSVGKLVQTLKTKIVEKSKDVPAPRLQYNSSGYQGYSANVPYSTR